MASFPAACASAASRWSAQAQANGDNSLPGQTKDQHDIHSVDDLIDALNDSIRAPSGIMHSLDNTNISESGSCETVFSI